MKRNIKIFLITIGVVLIWRGVWGIADIFLIPENPIVSFGISIIIGLVLLLVINRKEHDIRELL